MIIKRFNKRGLGTLALSQILTLILGTIAIAYAIGGNIGFVSGLGTCTQTDSKPKVENGKIVFCYGGADLDKDGKPDFLKYTVKSSTRIEREDNWYYTKEGNIWKWHNPAGNIGSVDATTETTTALSLWNKLTNEGTELYEQQSSSQPYSEWSAKKLLEVEKRENTPSATMPTDGSAAGYYALVAAAEKKKLEEKEAGAPPPEEGLVADTAIAKFLEKNLKMSTGAAIAVGHIIKGAATAVGIYFGIEALKGTLAGLGIPEEIISATQWAASVGWFAGEAAFGIAKALKAKAPGWWGIGIGVGVALVTFLIAYRKEDQKAVIFECLPWQPDTGGNNCDKCNKQGILPCSEYQCKSLGQGCQLLNDEESGEALCVWVNRQDTEYPTVRAWDGALLDDYSYSPNNKISPPDRGVLISYNLTKAATSKIIDDKKIGCIPAFTPLRFGVTTLDKDGKGEPAICKIDPIRKDNFDGMSFYIGGSSTFKYNHTQTLILPGAEAEGIEIGIGGEQELYVRCQDANGNSNPATFVFKFCIDEGPDTTPPLITATDVLNGMPIATGTQSIDVNVYINEPVPTAGGCKWSHNNQPYENMEKSMDCSAGDSLGDMNPQGLFTCRTTLDGLKDGVKNKFYFRCQDLKGNANSESYEFILLGSQPLVIDSVTPNGTTIKDSTDPVKVTINAKTSAGYKEGEATCYYSETGNEKDYVMFFSTVSYQHSQDLWLPEGSHTYYVKCIDLGGNADYERVSFKVETDTEPPVVVRAYHEDTYLKIITDEKAECVYDVANCNYPFDDGIDMRTSDGISHFTDWATNRNFYIKCKDVYGKQPGPDQCSIIVRPSQI